MLCDLTQHFLYSLDCRIRNSVKPLHFTFLKAESFFLERLFLSQQSMLSLVD